MTREEQRLREAEERVAHWRRWGPYLSERQWATVREDYSVNGDAWNFFPHEHARSRAYRWGEDGLAGLSDNHQRLCLALALWNERDPILKERLFGLTGGEGNHGEDVKEQYFYLDSTPTHSYMRVLYKYPQTAFPYTWLIEENGRRGREAPEFELADTGVFDESRYWDVVVEYAKAAPDDILMRVTATNRGPDPAPLHLVPTLWFRNTWSWDPTAPRPSLRSVPGPPGAVVVEARHDTLGRRWLACAGAPALLFTENETNAERLWGQPNPSPFVKDGIHEHLVAGRRETVNPVGVGTKVGVHHAARVEPGGSLTARVRLADSAPAAPVSERWFDEIIAQRQQEADAFYAGVIPGTLSADGQAVMRQALGGLLWSKQFYHYDVRRWLAGDPVGPPPPPQRRAGRNHDWQHVYNEDVISMPDKWEYPWYAAWDLAFHAIALALVDPEFAKAQLVLFLREWYMHPNGQIPAYEWNLGHVNPPVHAWAALGVYRMERRRREKGDRVFLERVFHKLLLNFTWWVNRKDAEGKNVFQGGFLGLDNIGLFDRSAPLPGGAHVEQSDGTSWMAMYCLNMLGIALELAREDVAYEDVASKFFEHFVYIAHAMHDMGGAGLSLWDEEDGFFYDVLHGDGRPAMPLRVRSMVGLIPLLAVEILEPDIVESLPGFRRRMQWFVDNHPEFAEHVVEAQGLGRGTRRLLSLVTQDQLPRVLDRMLDESEFLSPHGIRALSRAHRDRPFMLSLDGMAHEVGYEPGESRTDLFGGNSNWRGPIWIPMNYLLIESLQKFDEFFGGAFRVACPTNSDRHLSLGDVAGELSRRLTRIFLRDAAGRRPVLGERERFQRDPLWNDLVPFHEYFHGDTGAGLGASHQTGWTALVAKLLQESGE
jgi:hypothetical protein